MSCGKVSLNGHFAKSMVIALMRHDKQFCEVSATATNREWSPRRERYGRNALLSATSFHMCHCIVHIALEEPRGRGSSEWKMYFLTQQPTAIALPARPSFSMSAFFKDSDVTVHGTCDLTAEISDLKFFGGYRKRVTIYALIGRSE